MTERKRFVILRCSRFRVCFGSFREYSLIFAHLLDSFTAPDGSLRVNERHKQYGDYTFDYPAKEALDKDRNFSTKVPMEVAALAGDLEGLSRQDAIGLIGDLSEHLMRTFSGQDRCNPSPSIYRCFRAYL
jgi:hypothetical protein